MLRKDNKKIQEEDYKQVIFNYYKKLLKIQGEHEQYLVCMWKHEVKRDHQERKSRVRIYFFISKKLSTTIYIK